MENAIQEMEDQDVQSYILDLRNNPVSLLFSICQLRFLKSKHWFLVYYNLFNIFLQGGLVKAGLDVAQIWLDGDETLVNTIDRDGNMLPINMIDGHALTHDPLVVLVSSISP